MKALRKGDKGKQVEAWQLFLIGTGHLKDKADGDFGTKTFNATKSYQAANGLHVDGVAGNDTLGLAMTQGFTLISDPLDTTKSGPNWPPKPSFSALTHARRVALFGNFQFTAKPNGEIRILGNWEQQNIVKVTLPQLVGVTGAPANGVVRFHTKAAPQLQAMFAAWEAAGLKDRILTWAGSHYPRLKRGKENDPTPENLSNHSWGTALDINVAWNQLGQRPALLGEKGCVRELVTIANDHGFYWGGHFSSRADGMHFEVAKIV